MQCSKIGRLAALHCAGLSKCTVQSDCSSSVENVFKPQHRELFFSQRMQPERVSISSCPPPPTSQPLNPPNHVPHCPWTNFTMLQTNFVYSGSGPSEAIPTMTSLAPFAEMRMMRALGFARVRWWNHHNPAPFFEAIRNPFCVRVLVQGRAAQLLALLAPLVVYAGVVLALLGIHSYGDGDLFAGPTIRRTSRVVATETAHDVGVVFPCVGGRTVHVVKVEIEPVFYEPERHLGVQVRIHGPQVGVVRLSSGHGEMGKSWGRVERQL